MQNYDKPFKTYEEMIQLMESRNIIIDDKCFAIHALENLSYYGIVNGYKDNLISLSNPDKFTQGTRFKDLYFLCMFDNNLNSVMLKYILYIEKALKLNISYLVSEKYGVFTDINDYKNSNPDDYLFRKNYSTSNGRRENILTKIKKSVGSCKHPSVLF